MSPDMLVNMETKNRQINGRMIEARLKQCSSKKSTVKGRWLFAMILTQANV
jgi:hypothetical protein